MHQYKSSQSGFTLPEMAMVIVTSAVLMTAGIRMFLDYQQNSKILTTQSRMQDIDNALIQYQSVNGVLPCPTSLTDPQGSQNFGVEITAIPGLGPGPGTDCAIPPYAGTYPGTWMTLNMTAPNPNPTAYTNPAPAIVATGAVPVRTLNLPDQDIADGWGDRFSYTVTDALTITNGYDQTQGAIFVIDRNGNYIAPAKTIPPPTDNNPAAQYVIVSYGADRAGAYTIAGTPSGTLCPPAAALEHTNCTFPSQVFRQSQLNSNQAGNNMFDDYVIFHALIASTGATPSGLIAPFALQGGACPAGWSTPFPFTPTNWVTPACTLCSNLQGCTPQVICCKKQ